MKLEIQDTVDFGTTSLVSHARDEITQGFRTFRDHIKQMSVELAPAAGPSHRCVVRVQLRCGHTSTTDHTWPCAFVAVDRALQRTKQMIRTRLTEQNNFI